MTEQESDYPSTPAPARRLASAFLPLVVLAILGLIGWRILDAIQTHSFNSSGSAPDSVQLVEGQTYVLSAQGGVGGLAARGITLTSQCQIVSGGRVQPLTVTPYTADSRTVNAIATFQSPVSGAARLLCTGITPVWVDDSEDAAPDYAGLLLVAAIGFGLAAVVIRLYFGYAAGATDGGDSDLGDGEQVEAAVGVGVADESAGRSDARVDPDGEVPGADSGDVSR
ncbi:hypothetical protein SAMN05444157_2677 [Frankineae bacterium MT45]|nr:hypothetical protein SAMN05444157_2677 [Frankineae bacterium MT45]